MPIETVELLQYAKKYLESVLTEVNGMLQVSETHVKIRKKPGPKAKKDLVQYAESVGAVEEPKTEVVTDKIGRKFDKKKRGNAQSAYWAKFKTKAARATE